MKRYFYGMMAVVFVAMTAPCVAFGATAAKSLPLKAKDSAAKSDDAADKAKNGMSLLGAALRKAVQIETPEKAAKKTGPQDSDAVKGAAKVAPKTHEKKAGLASAAPKWLEGTWEGEGYQPNTQHTWTIKLVALPEEGIYTIEYPSLNCGGVWKFDAFDGDAAWFLEMIKFGNDFCVDNGNIAITRINDKFITFSYFTGDILNSWSTLIKKD